MYPNLKLQLWKSGMRQNRLAKLLGLEESSLSRIVNGFREPSIELRQRMAALLDSDERWLFESVDAHASLGGALGDERDPRTRSRDSG